MKELEVRSAPAKKARSFGELLKWHLDHGTRPNGQPTLPGRPWTPSEFAAALGESSERAIRYWMHNRYLPRKTVVEAIEQAFFGQSVAYDRFRREFRGAYSRAATHRSRIQQPEGALESNDVEHQLPAAFAALFSGFDKCADFLGRTGFPQSQMPGWTNALDFWTSIIRSCRDGASGTQGDINLLLQAAIQLYPTNPRLREIALKSPYRQIFVESSDSRFVLEDVPASTRVKDITDAIPDVQTDRGSADIYARSVVIDLVNKEGNYLRIDPTARLLDLGVQEGNTLRIHSEKTAGGQFPGNPQILNHIGAGRTFQRATRVFLDEYLVSEAGDVPFGGRDRELEHLDAWLSDNKAAPRMLVTAPAGRGKSALMVQWIKSLKDRGLVTEDGWQLAFVPISIRVSTNRPSEFLGGLARRLAEITGEPVLPEAVQNADALNGTVQDQLESIAATNRRVLVVVDGLDEALQGSFIPTIFPARLPQTLRILVSARWQVGDIDSTGWLKRLGWDRNIRVESSELERLSAEAIADVLVKLGAPVLAQQWQIVDRLSELTEGEPILVRFYA